LLAVRERRLGNWFQPKYEQTMSTRETLPPNYKKLDVALRSIGYSLEVAVADLIDNCIDAKAKNVLVRLVTRPDGQLDLAILDDGTGMDERTLKEAMRFGADVTDEINRLGKFGLGLKLASLSQAREFSVLTAKDSKVSGRAWHEEGIADGFASTVYDQSECKELLSQVVPDHPLKTSGTVVWWSSLYRIGQRHNVTDEQVQKLVRRLENYLALALHRFLSGKAWKITITLDVFDQASKRLGIPIRLDPLDPFEYDHSGNADFPAAMTLDAEYKDRIKIKAHIWPPNSTAPNYKLPGGSNARQGFYFYRNNRLIQGGGWNGMREAEPHSSLARLEIDMAPDFDVDVSLDVKKAEIQLPPPLAGAIRKAKTAIGADFKKYLSLADEAYRKRQVTEAELPLIPSEGLPADLSRFLHDELRIKSTAKHRDLKIVWEDFDGEKLFFDIDRDRGLLFLNRAYRKQLLHGLPGSATDIPVVKCLLFLLVEDALSSERMGPKIRERIEQLNRILVQAVKYERTAD
jgi:histidine kinase/DNA gyrase B/HSP90-like ATPase